jgi:hypothetical protein
MTKFEKNVFEVVVFDEESNRTGVSIQGGVGIQF